MSNPSERAVRQAVLDLADEGRPVNLGEQALRGVRRRRVRSVAASAVAVVAVIAAVSLWPGLGHRTAVPPADPAPTVSEGRWPTFGGLGLVPAPPRGEAADTTPEAAGADGDRGLPDAGEPSCYVLDPTTLGYRPAPATAVAAVSPDLRYALVSREQAAGEETEPGRAPEIGFYDTVAGRVLGEVDLTPFAGEGEFAGVERRLVARRRHRRGPAAGRPAGPGWAVTSLVLIDVRTGAVRSVALRPANGLEPQALVGWAHDRRRLIFEADPVGTDLAPTGHLLVDPETGTSAGVTWPTQGRLLTGPGTDDVAMMSIDEQCRHGAGPGHRARSCRSTHRSSPLTTDVTALVWRGGEVVAMDQDCDRRTAAGGDDPRPRPRGRRPERVLAVTGGSTGWVWLALGQRSRPDGELLVGRPGPARRAGGRAAG